MPSVPNVAETKSVWLDNVVYALAEKRLHLVAPQASVRQASEADQKAIGSKSANRRKKRQGAGERVSESSNQSKQSEDSVVLPEEKPWVEVSQDPFRESAKTELKACTGSSAGIFSTLADEIARARQHIKNTLQCEKGIELKQSGSNDETTIELTYRVNRVEECNLSLNETVTQLKEYVLDLEDRIRELENTLNKKLVKVEQPIEVAKVEAPSAPVIKKDDDDDVDLFGSEDEDNEENEKLKQERLKAYEAKKSKKPALIAKSNVILDVKPWDDETDMKEMERKVREIKFDGLVWGASKFVPLAYGIQKLQISCVVEDEKVSVDLLQEEIEALEDLVQSMDIAAFNKV